MATTWVLHTETKGTGAQMVPLEQITNRSSSTEPVFVPRKVAKTPVREVPKPKAARRFRIVDVMTRQVLADDVGTRAAVDALRDVRSVVDVNVYVWQEERGGWWLLSLAEQRTMLELARASADPASDTGAEAA
jgi:hypothetical protein